MVSMTAFPGIEHLIQQDDDDEHWRKGPGYRYRLAGRGDTVNACLHRYCTYLST